MNVVYYSKVLECGQKDKEEFSLINILPFDMIAMVMRLATTFVAAQKVEKK